MSVTPQLEPLDKIRSNQMVKLLSSGKRIDGRDLHSFRDIKIEKNPIDKAEGSASVSMGKTQVLVGVKVDVGEPFPDTPNNGVLTVNAEFVPLAYEHFEPGPPSENAIELARIVDRGIRESGAIDLDKLVLIAGKKVYVIFIDIYILNHDGNLTDASEYAAINALTNTEIPNYEVTESGDVQRATGYSKLPVREHPFSTTLVKINDKLMVDPNLEEERISDVKVTMTLTKTGKICAIQKSGNGTFTVEEILEAEKVARKKSEEIRNKFYPE